MHLLSRNSAHSSHRRPLGSRQNPYSLPALSFLITRRPPISPQWADAGLAMPTGFCAAAPAANGIDDIKARLAASIETFFIAFPWPQSITAKRPVLRQSAVRPDTLVIAFKPAACY